MVFNLKEALEVLGITHTGDHPPKLKFVQKRFYQLSLIHHPDRPGGDNNIQQKITAAYKFIGDFIEKNYESKDDNEEEIARQVYRNFKLGVKENLFSFTISIDNNLSFIWDDVLTDHYGSPVDRQTNGKHWKHLNFSDDDSNTGDISIGKWHMPKKDKQSKILIQANTAGNILPAHYVSFVLPKLLAEVKEKALTKMPQLAGRSHHNLPPNSALKQKCALCYFQASSKSQLSTHVKKTHKKSLKSLKALSCFEIPAPLNVLPSTPGLEPTRIRCYLCTDSYYNEGEWEQHREMCHAFPCTFCEKVCTTSSELDVHILLLHENELTAAGYQRDSQTENTEVVRDCSYIKCDHCNFSTRLRRAMKTHIQKQHVTQTLLACTLCEYSTTSMSGRNLETGQRKS